MHRPHNATPRTIGLRRLCIAATLTLATPAFATDDEGLFAVDGIGAASCDNFLTAVAERDTSRVDLDRFIGWTDGFITGMNVLSSDTFDLTPWQSIDVILLQMQAFCTENPETPYVNGLGQLVSVLSENRVETSSEMVQIRVGDQAVFLYEQTIADIHAALTAQGYTDLGPSDSFTEALGQGLQAFQADQGLTVTGLPDQPTLLALQP